MTTPLYPSAAEVTRLSPASAARLQELAQELLAQADAVADLVNRRAIAAEPGLADPDDRRRWRPCCTAPGPTSARSSRC